MNDVSKTNEALIAEAQEHYSEMNGLNSRAAEVMMELVAALEAKTGVRVDMSSAVGVEAQLAATSVPVQGEPNDDRTPEFEAIEQELFNHQPLLSMQDGSIRGCKCMDRVFVTKAEDWGTHLAEVFTRLSRATVPDTATAALERVRAIAERHGVKPWTEEIFAALDGAPEPEWEYGYRGRYAVMHPTKAGQRIETPEITQRTPDNWLPEMGEIYRRRPSTPAGPWLPVEGESAP